MRLIRPSSPFRSNPYPSYAILIIGLGFMAVNFMHHRWTRDGPGERGVIHWDVISYYSYLPATFIYDDVTLSFLDHPPEGFVNDSKFWPTELENGNRLIITSMGLSVLYSPFFFVAHALAPVFGKTRDGFGSTYQFFLVLSALFYVILGLVILKNILLRYFKPKITALSLLAVAFGTNLLYYTTYEGAMAHSYGFFLIILFLWTVIRWYEHPTAVRTILTGALFGFICLVRPTNVLVFFILFLWDVKSVGEMRARIIFFLRKFHLVLLMVAAFILVWIPQFLYWKEITGHYLFFSYGAEGASFYWAHPHIWQSLFGFKKGWFIYTPLMLLAVAGIPRLRGRRSSFFLPVLILLLAMIYVQSAWWSWWFGGGFGLRTYIDIYGILALPLAASLEWIFSLERKKIRLPILGMVCLMILFQLFNTYQYTHNIIHHVGMNRYTYLRSFLRSDFHPDHWTTLSMPDYQLARQGIYVFYLTGPQYDYLKEMEKAEAMEEVDALIREDRRLEKEISWYAKREGIEALEARTMIAERMYSEMIK